MKYVTIVFLLLISFKLVSQPNQRSLQIGTYGSYLDISTYVELKLKEDSTFIFVDRGFTGISDIYHGKWKIQKKKLILYDYEIKIRPGSFKERWSRWKTKGETLISKQGLRIELKK
jgi:hypothetical protein